MSRTARAYAAEVCYHVLNRGNARGEIFHRDDYYQEFVKLIQEGLRTLADARAGSAYHAKPLPSRASALR